MTQPTTRITMAQVHSRAVRWAITLTTVSIVLSASFGAMLGRTSRRLCPVPAVRLDRGHVKLV